MLLWTPFQWGQGSSGLVCVRRRPTSQQMAKRLLGICQAEGLQVNEATLACLVEGSNGDIRAILGQLQMIRLRRSVLAYDDAKVPGSFLCLLLSCLSEPPCTALCRPHPCTTYYSCSSADRLACIWRRKCCGQSKLLKGMIEMQCVVLSRGR